MKINNYRLLFYSVICLFYSAFLFSQKNTFLENEGELKKFEPHFRFEYSGTIGFSTNKDYKFLVGGEGGLLYYFNKKNALTINFGYNYAFDGNTKELGYIPLKTGFKTFIQTGRIYLQGEVGMGVSTTKGYNGSGFLWAPSVGYITHSGIDLGLKYESLSKFNSNQILLRTAYSFKI